MFLYQFIGSIAILPQFWSVFVIAQYQFPVGLQNRVPAHGTSPFRRARATRLQTVP